MRMHAIGGAPLGDVADDARSFRRPWDAYFAGRAFSSASTLAIASSVILPSA